jgi:nucleoside-diphosphate-sugar epimerase
VDCLVTGASGYVGSALAQALRASGIPTRAVVHRGEAPAGFAGPAGECLRADITRGLSASAMAGVDTVYHLAGLAHQRATDAEYAALNVDATIALAQAAAEAGVRRFVYLSSVKAALPPPDAGAYGRSKAAAEQELRALAASSDLEIAIVRPALVYGGPVRGYLALLRRWVELRLPAPPPGGERAMVSRGDLVALLLRLHQRPLQSPLCVTVTDGERYSARRLHRALCDALGKPPWLPSPPAVLWRGGARLADLLVREEAGSTWRRLQGSEYVERSDLQQLVGFVPAERFEDTLLPAAAGVSE